MLTAYYPRMEDANLWETLDSRLDSWSRTGHELWEWDWQDAGMESQITQWLWSLVKISASFPKSTHQATQIPIIQHNLCSSKYLCLKVSCADEEEEEQKTGAIPKDDVSFYSALLGFFIRIRP